MKKYALLLSSLVVTILIIYACQKDHPSSVSNQNAGKNTPENAVSDRADYTDCESCLNDCDYCCVTLLPGEFTHGGSVTYVFNKPGLGTPRVITFTAAVPGPLTVCADIGNFYIYNNKPSSSDAAMADACSVNSTVSCPAGYDHTYTTLNSQCGFPF